ncbi:putative 5-formyltetrahydrofolate cyclo-ligase-family protein [Rodentibacter pneumotropicus]|uniref:Putative 5-formyltetrahydrofolate cyclo-ligase-family protein n=1 Tax=Rodentibacter pneumotropicus TaxID=758 RepID=A0A448MTD9_9PAST|nr:putative 5-formyltetrahydrofolate cyclo-ligase-family protein [Rodentibacter pneumotropicus]
MNTQQQRQQIRRQIRKTRANLTALQQRLAEQAITGQALDVIEHRQARNIALYLSFDGEISTDALIKPFGSKIKRCFCPSCILLRKSLTLFTVFA